MCMCVCMPDCRYAHVCAHAWIWACTHTGMNKHVCPCVYVHQGRFTYVPMCMCVGTRVCIRVFMCMHVGAYTHVGVHMLYVHICWYTSVQACTCTPVGAYTRRHMCVCAPMEVRMHIYVHLGVCECTHVFSQRPVPW